MDFTQDKRYYEEYKLSLHKKFERQLGYIETVYNFDLGDEFEIAICKILRSFLPQKFGICRGFVVNEDHMRVGDDIIIYDQQRFPTMRLLGKGDFCLKESIPVEAVYAYIEAKHTFDINLDDNEKCVFQKAVRQCLAVKDLINMRDETFSGDIDPYLESNLEATQPLGFPKRRNPPVGIILSRYIANKGNRLTNQEDITSILKTAVSRIKKNSNSPDLFVCGNSNIISPTVYIGDSKGAVPFYNSELPIEYGHHIVQNSAFGHFLATLGFVVDYMRLGKMPWIKMLNNHFVN